MASSPSTVIDMQQLLQLKQRVQSARLRRESFAERLASNHRRVSAALKSSAPLPKAHGPSPAAPVPPSSSSSMDVPSEKPPTIAKAPPPNLRKFFSPRVSSAGLSRPSQPPQPQPQPQQQTPTMASNYDNPPPPSPRETHVSSASARRPPQVSSATSGAHGGFSVQPHHQLRRALTEAVSHAKLLVQQADELREFRLAERQKVADSRSAEWRRVTAGNLLAFGADVQTVRRMLNGELSEVVEEVVRCISAASYMLSSGASSWLRPRSASSSSVSSASTSSDHLRESLVEGGALGLRLCDALGLIGDHCRKFVSVCCGPSEAELVTSLIKGLGGLVSSGRDVLLRILDTHDRRRIAEVQVEESKQKRGEAVVSPTAASIQRWFSVFDTWWHECRAAIEEIPPSTTPTPGTTSAGSRNNNGSTSARSFSTYPTPPPANLHPPPSSAFNPFLSNSFSRWHSRPPSAGSARPQSAGTSRPGSASTARPQGTAPIFPISTSALLLESLVLDEIDFAAFLEKHGTVDSFLRRCCELPACYEGSSARLPSSSSIVAAIPWPTRSLSVLKQYLGTADDGLMWSSCKHPRPEGFKGAPSVGEHIRSLQRRWHPDRLQNALPAHSSGSDECLVDELRLEIMRQATAVAQAINAVKEQLEKVDSSVPLPC